MGERCLCVLRVSNEAGDVSVKASQCRNRVRRCVAGGFVYIVTIVSEVYTMFDA